MVSVETILHSLRQCAKGDCSECHVANEENCGQVLMLQSADMIEKLREELIYQMDNETENEEYAESINTEMGFGPYLGCYTDDC